MRYNKGDMIRYDNRTWKIVSLDIKGYFCRTSRSPIRSYLIWDYEAEAFIADSSLNRLLYPELIPSDKGYLE